MLCDGRTKPPDLGLDPKKAVAVVEVWNRDVYPTGRNLGTGDEFFKLATIARMKLGAEVLSRSF